MSNTIHRMIQRRKQLKWSETDLADQCQLAGWSVTRDTIHNIEQGRRRLSPDELPCLARALKVDPNYLVGWEP